MVNNQWGLLPKLGHEMEDYDFYVKMQVFKFKDNIPTGKQISDSKNQFFFYHFSAPLYIEIQPLPSTGKSS